MNQEQQQQSNDIKKSRLDRLVVRLSSWIILLQSIFTIPPFIVMLYFGVVYQNQCSIQPLILTFLIVHGCSNFVNGVMLLTGFITANYIKRSSTPSPCARRLLIGSLIGQLILLLFSIAWLVAGQIWVFGAQRNGFQSNDSTHSATYCHSTIFWNAFAVIIITYAIWFILLLVLMIRYIIKRQKIKRSNGFDSNTNSDKIRSF